MEKKILFFTITGDDGFDCTLKSSFENNGVEIYDFELLWDLSNITQKSCFKFSWSIPMAGFLYRWNPDCKFERNVTMSWGKTYQSMISSSAPLDCFYDGNSTNKYTWSLSECAKLIRYKSGVCEETGELECMFELPADCRKSLFCIKQSGDFYCKILILRNICKKMKGFYCYSTSILPAFSNSLLQT